MNGYILEIYLLNLLKNAIRIAILFSRKKKLLYVSKVFISISILFILESKEIKGLKYKEDHWVKILYILDRTEHITFVDYLFIRRVAVAFANCATLGYIKINRLYCALSITSPRANKHFFP